MKTHRYTSAKNHLQVTETTQRIATRRTRTRWKNSNSEQMPCSVHFCTKKTGGAGNDYGPSTHSRHRTAHNIGPQHRQTHTTAETAHDAARGRARCSRMSSRSGLGHNCMDKSLVCALPCFFACRFGCRSGCSSVRSEIVCAPPPYSVRS
jgi:hypothetical protein